jgi:hypothetical protein
LCSGYVPDLRTANNIQGCSCYPRPNNSTKLMTKKAVLKILTLGPKVI